MVKLVVITHEEAEQRRKEAGATWRPLRTRRYARARPVPTTNEWVGLRPDDVSFIHEAVREL